MFLITLLSIWYLTTDDAKAYNACKKIAKYTMQKASPGVTFVNNVSLYDWLEIYVSS